MTVVAETGSGEDAVSLFAEHKPDITLMDLRLPGMSGVHAISIIRARHPAAKFVVLTTYEGDEDIYRALEAGARGYIIKGADRDEIIRAIRAVAEGDVVIGRGIAERALAYFATASPRASSTGGVRPPAAAI